ncbi:MAG: DUF4124 domain-containing protein [Pseudomonadota bacterium]
MAYGRGALLWLVAAVMPAGAQVYQCEGPDGVMVFSDSVCAPTAEELEVEEGYRGDVHSRAHGERLRVEQLRHREQREKETALRQETRSDEPRENPVEARTRWRNMAVSGRVAVGMPEAFVRRSWGDPDRINRSTRSAGTREQWVYRRDRSRAQYIHMEGGVVTSIQN